MRDPGTTTLSDLTTIAIQRTDTWDRTQDAEMESQCSTKMIPLDILHRFLTDHNSFKQNILSVTSLVHILNATEQNAYHNTGMESCRQNNQQPYSYIQ